MSNNSGCLTGRSGRPSLVTIYSTFDQHYFKTSCGCWVWLRGCNAYGYGVLRDPRTATVKKATHIMWEKSTGKLPTLEILHTCNVAACVNPAHLYEGTAYDNCQDRKKAGTQYVPPTKRGVENHFSKLNDEQIRSIRSDPRVQRVIAKDFGICQLHVSRIKRRLVWEHVDG